MCVAGGLRQDTGGICTFLLTDPQVTAGPGMARSSRWQDKPMAAPPPSEGHRSQEKLTGRLRGFDKPPNMFIKCIQSTIWIQKYYFSEKFIFRLSK